MPGSSPTMDRRFPVMALNKVDLPTLGLPTITIDGSRSLGGMRLHDSVSNMDRRAFLAASLAGSVAGLRGSTPEYERPLFDLHKVSKSPVKIASIEILQAGRDYFVRSRSTDG